jgi:hypothetical protein
VSEDFTWLADYAKKPIVIAIVSISLSQNGAGLGAMWGKEKAVEMINDTGFTKVEVKKLPHDFQNYYYIAYKNK